MNIFQTIDCLYLFDKLIRDETTGTPEEFAERINVGRTKLFSLIEEFNSRGCRICYSRTRCTYYYKTPVEINISLTIRPLCRDEAQDVSGGAIFSLIF